MTHWDSFGRILTGRPNQPAPQALSAMEGTVLTVAAAEATFILDDYHPDLKFGPAPFGRTSTPPQVGDRCLVIFVGEGIDKPWLLRWSGP